MENFISEYPMEHRFLTPEDGAQYFFGYYDMLADDGSGRHLCHRVQFANRLPTAQDIAEIGYLKNRKFVPFAETTAWNFQQGAMLEYHPSEPNTVFYNTVRHGNFVTAIHNFKTGSLRFSDRPAACHSPDGKWGLSVNFGRIFDFRQGYGYAGMPDPDSGIAAPADDGIFLIDFVSGTSELLFSLSFLAPLSGFGAGEKLLVNHITFSPDNNRFLFLLRNFPSSGKPWLTSLFVADRSGDVRAVLRATYVSHYYWLNSEEVVAHCTTVGQKKSMYRLNVVTGEATEYGMPYFDRFPNGDIHCRLSPDGKRIIGDGYEFGGYRRVMEYDPATGNSRELFAARSPRPANLDIRCDLHVRCIGNGWISYDTTERGIREIAAVKYESGDFYERSAVVQ